MPQGALREPLYVCTMCAQRLHQMSRVKINNAALKALQPGEILSDQEVTGFVARRLQSGTVTFSYRYWSGGRQRWARIGLWGSMTVDQARKLAKIKSGQVAEGRDPSAERQKEIAKRKTGNIATVNDLLDQYVKMDVEARKLSSADEIKRTFNVYVRPRIGKVAIGELSLDHIVTLQDEVADRGLVMSDRMLGRLARALRWYQRRDGSFRSPIVPGMRKTKDAERARTRILDDQEIRDVWIAVDRANVPQCYPRFIRALLLGGQRLRETSGTLWPEINLERDLWVIPRKGEPNSKKRGKSGNVVPMNSSLWQQFGGPRKEGFVFSNDGGKRAFSGFSKAKVAFDAAIDALRKEQGRSEMPHWQYHDLRRTARTLLSRAGVNQDICDRVTAHTKPGIRKVYDHWDFLPEKREALEKLAKLIGEILSKGRP